MHGHFVKCKKGLWKNIVASVWKVFIFKIGSNVDAVLLVYNTAHELPHTITITYYRILCIINMGHASILPPRLFSDLRPCTMCCHCSWFDSSFPFKEYAKK